MKKPILSLDFDGVIHSYTSGWKGAHIIPDTAVPGAIDFIMDALKHFEVAVFSSRSKNIRGRFAMRQWLYRQLVNWEWDRAEKEWQERFDVTPEWTPWTHGDVDDLHRDLAKRALKQIKWPWFKPPALVTIDDRALTFTGEWPSIQELRAFKPWNK